MKYDSEEYVYMIETDHGINRGFAVQVDYFEIDPADMHAGEYEQKHISYTILVTLWYYDDGKLVVDKVDTELPDDFTQVQLDKFEDKLIKLHEEYLKSEYSEGEL